jgi:hypothetical protein
MGFAGLTTTTYRFWAESALGRRAETQRERSRAIFFKDGSSCFAAGACGSALWGRDRRVGD